MKYLRRILEITDEDAQNFAWWVLVFVTILWTVGLFVLQALIGRT